MLESNFELVKMKECNPNHTNESLLTVTRNYVQLGNRTKNNRTVHKGGAKIVIFS